jgi:hypothetical protein
MQVNQASMLQSLRAVQGFLDANHDQLANVVTSGARKKLDEAIIELAGHVENQSGNILQAKGSTKEQRVLRKTLLRDHIAPIAKIAASELAGTPNIEPLRMPKGWYRGERLAAAARGMAKTAEQFSSTFIGFGLPADFVQRLIAATDAMMATFGARRESRHRHVGATRGLKAKLTQGRRVVGIIDAFLQSALKDDESLLAQWDSVKRVQLVTGGRPTPPAEPTATGLPSTGGAV